MNVLPVSPVAFATSAAKSWVFSPLKSQRGLRASAESSSRSSWNVSLWPGVTVLVTAKIRCLLIPFLATHTQFEVALVQYFCSCCYESVRMGFLRQMLYFSYMWLFNIKTRLTAGLVLSQDGFHDATEIFHKFLFTLRKVCFLLLSPGQNRSHINVRVCIWGFLKERFQFHRFLYFYGFFYFCLQCCRG